VCELHELGGARNGVEGRNPGARAVVVVDIHPGGAVRVGDGHLHALNAVQAAVVAHGDRRRAGAVDVDVATTRRPQDVDGIVVVLGPVGLHLRPVGLPPTVRIAFVVADLVVAAARPGGAGVDLVAAASQVGHDLGDLVRESLRELVDVDGSVGVIAGPGPDF